MERPATVRCVVGVIAESMTENIEVMRPCPVCASPFTAYLRHVPTRRTKRSIPLYVCLDCDSLSNPSGYVETPEQLAADLQWHISVAVRNRDASGRLFDRFEAAGVRPRTILEVGCGIGTTVGVARGRGMQARGFDTNVESIDYGRKSSGLDLVGAQWSRDTDTGPIDLYLCLSVCEHLAEPRRLIADLCSAAAGDGAALFIAVPVVDRRSWTFLIDPSPYDENTPFFDNDVHVTHFSRKGLEMVVREFGAPSYEFFLGGMWNGALARF